MKPATDRMVTLRVRGLDCWAVSGLGCGSLIAPAIARIADLAPDARTDHTGALLLFLDRGQVSEVQARLNELGYQSESVSGAGVPGVTGWYTPEQLSSEEAEILAARLVPAFARDQRIAGTAIAAVQERVAAALFSSFTDASFGSRRAAARGGRAAAIAGATRNLIGSPKAQALGEFVDRWLERGRTT